MLKMAADDKWDALINGQKLRLDIIVDQGFYDPDELLKFFPEMNTLSGGAYIQRFGEASLDFIESESDWYHRENVRVYAEYDFGMDIEQNFGACGDIPAFKEIFRGGSKYLFFNVVGVKRNHYSKNKTSGQQPQPQPQQYFPQQPAQYPFFQPQPQQQQQQQQQHFSQQQQPNFGGPPTPQHSNATGFQHQYASPQQQYAAPVQQPPAPAQYVSPPVQQQQFQPQASPPFGPAAAQAQYVSPQVQQYMTPPVQQQYVTPPVQQQYQPPAAQLKAPPKAPPVQVHRMQTRIQDPKNLPTPGVPKAAGVPKNMSIDTSEYTEETVSEEETPKTPSFFRRVASTLTGQSTPTTAPSVPT